jgi:hypothetical protein
MKELRPVLVCAHTSTSPNKWSLSEALDRRIATQIFGDPEESNGRPPVASEVYAGGGHRALGCDCGTTVAKLA